MRKIGKKLYQLFIKRELVRVMMGPRRHYYRQKHGMFQRRSKYRNSPGYIGNGIGCY